MNQRGWSYVPSKVCTQLPPSLQNLDTFAVKTVEVCKDILLARRDSGQVWMEGDHTTSVDCEIESAVINLVDQHFGDVTILSEEWFDRSRSERNPGRELRAIIDPLDGSRHYFEGRPNFACSVAFELDKRVVASFVYLPAPDYGYVAVEKGGAWRNGLRVFAPQSAQQKTVLVSPLDSRIIESLLILKGAGYRLEPIRGSAYSLCDVTEGKVAGAIKRIGVESGVPRIWGVAGAALICHEAGLAVLDSEGAVWSPSARTIFVCNNSSLTGFKRQLRHSSVENRGVS